MQNFLLYVDRYSLFVVTWSVFISIYILSFSKQFMEGDRKYSSFISTFVLLFLSTTIMMVCNNLVLFIIMWCLRNALGVKMMIHKSEWKAAYASGVLAAKNLMLSSAFVGLGLFVLYLETGKACISDIIQFSEINTIYSSIALVFILIGAMVQSAILPFHKWFISSLNSPTPVSANINAGLINGGVFILIRFAPLYLNHPWLLDILFLVGLLSAILGTFWKLIQNDYKRMLVCSTISQMGFIVMQCGLGLFSAASAHVCWHALFKTYLFLGSGSTVTEKYKPDAVNFRLQDFILALPCGLIGSYIFAIISDKSWLLLDSNLVLVVISFIASAQAALIILASKSWRNLLIAVCFVIVFSASYGFSSSIICALLKPLYIDFPQPLNNWHVFGIVILGLAWLLIIFKNTLFRISRFSNIISKFYVKALNSSQPHYSTVTAHHNDYSY